MSSDQSSFGKGRLFAFALETANYLLRRLEPNDASLALAGWTLDPVAAEMLNTGKRLWPVDEQRQYFASHAATDKQVLIGIFPKGLTNSPLGILILKPDLQTGVFVISVLIGSKPNRGGNTVAQSTFPVVDRLFNEYGFAKGKCHVRPQNKAVQWLLLQGPWRREARLKGELLDAATGKRTDLLVFGVLKEDWLDFHARRPARQNG